MRNLLLSLLAFVFAAVLSLPAHADFIVYGTSSNDALAPGASLEDVRLTVELSVTDGLATMTLTNTSISPAVFKEIVIDTYDDDTGTAILFDPTVLTDTAEVGYDLGPSNGLPGYKAVTRDAYPLLELRAKAPPPRKGLGMGETLLVQFQTPLPNGSDMNDYLAGFGGGQDTAHYAIGFQATGAEAVNGGSLCGMYVPEPAAAVVLVLGALAALKRRRIR